MRQQTSRSFNRERESHAAQPEENVRVLGVRIDSMRLRDLLDFALSAVWAQRRATIFYVNAHCMNVAATDPVYCGELEAADIVYCDGTGVRLGAWLSRQHLPERMTGADWITDLCECAARQDASLFLVGGREEVAEQAARILRERHPGLRIVGAHGGYDLGAGTIEEINELRPDILLVGMGTPCQEKWVASNRSALEVPVVWTVGALFDFVTGRIPRGPSWMTQHGLEWLCRLTAEPKKLWRRYLVGNPQFLGRILVHHWIRPLFARLHH